MNENNFFYSKDISLFYESFKDVRKIKQDTVFHNSVHRLKKQHVFKRKMHVQDAHSHCFNSNSSHNFVFNSPFSFIRNKLFKSELKKLKNGKYIPDICIDVHGLTQYQVKQELGKLIATCHEEKIFCFSIIHGHGKEILKYQIPIWLSQHPDIIAFNQAPKRFGNHAALLVLIKPDT